MNKPIFRVSADSYDNSIKLLPVNMSDALADYMVFEARKLYQGRPLTERTRSLIETELNNKLNLLIIREEIFFEKDRWYINAWSLILREAENDRS